ncbi:beta-N-acetylhexosaminidase [Alkaliphilus peptidifermentans]|uniref:Beta-N-acetylhexosaminidase n=1 Tax=Alkaliphilus peptidifermentans DSM 18978 TaxID=1120976 RepID=A0A1G5JTV6_9FIRM|nr:beta-N-acetylhexosaminidase [Alkaliphilus peptidifermentans]SCY91300.1 beta-N-acetylhexosaminidase [Alkaliphilus peptidifermentans DSM 18978]
MSKKLTFFIVIIIALVLMSGCFPTIQEEKTENPPPQQNNDEENTEDINEEIKEDPIKKQIEKMTIDEKIGLLVIVGLDGYAIDDDSKSLIEEYYVGGFILFGRNVKNTNSLLQLINSLKSTNKNNKIPLFISIDEEGGRVSRVPKEFMKVPTNRKIGQINNKELSFEIGNVIGEKIRALGFNLNFAPVMDIDSNPLNPVIGDRSFGSDERIVSQLGIETMKGLQNSGVIPVVKHFPGHGDTFLDSHISLPTVDKDLNSLQQFELIPFKEAIDNNADAVMIAHILYSRIDSENPATLSKTIITEVLRNQMNFEGVVITDDMTMGAIIENYDIGDAAVKSVNAGSDIILVCHGYDNAIKVIKDLKSAVEGGIISIEKIDESLYRILQLKHKYDLKDEVIDSIDVWKINSQIEKILNEIQ